MHFPTGINEKRRGAQGFFAMGVDDGKTPCRGPCGSTHRTPVFLSGSRRWRRTAAPNTECSTGLGDASKGHLRSIKPEIVYPRPSPWQCDRERQFTRLAEEWNRNGAAVLDECSPAIPRPRHWAPVLSNPRGKTLHWRSFPVQGWVAADESGRIQARSKRSAFMTFAHAATKSWTNFALLSSWA